jgi:hypothetical protein
MAETFEIQCGHCDAKLRLGDRGAIGKRISCPKCREKFVVPAPASARPRIATAGGAKTAPPGSNARPAATKPAAKEPAPVVDDWDTEELAAGDTELDDNEFLSGLETAASATRRPKPKKLPANSAPARVKDQDAPKVIKATKEQIAAARERKANRWERSHSPLAQLGAFGWILGGMTGGGIGAALWATVACMTGYEMGMIAWVLGGMAGWGVRIGSGNDYGTPLGVTAVFCTFFSIVIARFIMILVMFGAHPIEAFIGAFVVTLSPILHIYNLIWLFLACFTAWRASMSEE